MDEFKVKAMCPTVEPSSHSYPYVRCLSMVSVDVHDLHDMLDTNTVHS